MGSQNKRADRAYKDTTSDYLALDVRLLQRGGFLVPGASFASEWKQGARIRGRTEPGWIVLSYVYRAGSEDWRRIEYPVLLTRTDCNYGGQRAWFLCPGKGCGRRVAILYSGETFVCRRCKQLAYPSQRQQPWQRVLARRNYLLQHGRVNECNRCLQQQTGPIRNK